MSPVVRATSLYVAAASLVAVVESIITTYVLNWYDPKFKDALSDALIVQLSGLGAFVIVASAVFALALQFLPATSTRSAAWRIALAGACYTLGALLLGPALAGTDQESWINPVTGWLYMIGYPLLALLLIRR